MENSNEEQQISPVQTGGIDWMECLYAVKKRIWLVVLMTVMGVAVSIVILARTTPVYAARSVLLIEQHSAQVVRMDSVDQSDARYPDVMNTLVETVRSMMFLQRVVDGLNLNENPDFLPKSPTGLPHTKEEALGMLAGCIKTNLRKNTRLLDIIAEHPNPEVARLLADGVAKEFIRYGNDQRVSSSQSANEFINDELNKLRNKLRRAEETLQKFPGAMETGAVEQNQDINVDQLKDLNTRFSNARAERLSLETDQARAIENANNPAELLKLPSVARQPIVAPLLSALVDKESNLVVLSQQYKSKHPKYITAVAEIKSLKDSLNQKAMEAAALISTACAIARDNEEKLSKSMHAQELVLAERNRRMVDYKVMKREYDADRTIFEQMQARMKEIDVTKNIDGSPIKIVDNATVPGLPIRPDKVQTLTVGTLLGFAMGVFGSVGINRFRRRIRTIAQAEDLIGLPVLGALMKRKKVNGESPKEFSLGCKGPDAEAFRSLQTAICVRVKSENRGTIMLTSAIPGEGKTYLSINLAATFAQSGTKTLLIDADLRKHTCSRILANNVKKAGFAEVLSGEMQLANVVEAAEIPNLYFMTAGINIQNPSQVLIPASLKAVFEQALKEYDQIIVDAPPVLAVSDSLLMAGTVQSICFVVGSGVSQCREVERACKLLADARKIPIGIAMNLIEPQWGDDGLYTKYYYPKDDEEPSGN